VKPCQPFNINLCRKLFSVLLLLLVVFFADAQEIMLTVIGNTKGAPNEMKMTELKSVFKGEKQRWSDKNKVTIVLMMTKTDIGKTTCSKVYQMSPQAVSRYLFGQQFAGKIDQPQFFNSADDLVAYVADNPGAIGISDKVPTNPKVKIITIDGKKSF
jgi:hypothetical protein